MNLDERSKKNNNHKKPKENEEVLVVGSSFDFWLNEEDDIYDEVYGKRNKREDPSKQGKFSQK